MSSEIRTEFEPGEHAILDEGMTNECEVIVQEQTPLKLYTFVIDGSTTGYCVMTHRLTKIED